MSKFKPNLADLIDDSDTPKYQQVLQLLVSDIQSGIYSMGHRIPSINETSEEYLISRDTVEKAYRRLRETGIIKSVPGKGYFVCKTPYTDHLKVCLLFNKLSNYKKETYEGFVQELGDRAFVDLHVYNYNIKVFERIIENNLTAYDYFVIIPHFHPGSRGVEDIVRKIPKEKVLIIDKKINLLYGEYPTVYQDFEEDIFTALHDALPLLAKYSQVNLLYPAHRFFSREIRDGFIRFGTTVGLTNEVVDQIELRGVLPGEAYVVISDDDLTFLLKRCNENGWVPGKDIGVLSYNETAVKEILFGGISTISTNHIRIGQCAAQMIIKGKFSTERIPFEFKNRGSL